MFHTRTHISTTSYRHHVPCALKKCMDGSHANAAAIFKRRHFAADSAGRISSCAAALGIVRWPAVSSRDELRNPTARHETAPRHPLKGKSPGWHGTSAARVPWPRGKKEDAALPPPIDASFAPSCLFTSPGLAVVASAAQMQTERIELPTKRLRGGTRCRHREWARVPEGAYRSPAAGLRLSLAWRGGSSQGSCAM